MLKIRAAWPTRLLRNCVPLNLWNLDRTKSVFYKRIILFFSNKYFSFPQYLFYKHKLFYTFRFKTKHATEISGSSKEEQLTSQIHDSEETKVPSTPITKNTNTASVGGNYEDQIDADGTEIDADESENDTNQKFENQNTKQCWDLYKKMSEKGVVVSFDTILRGMLTPTEYRLHRSRSSTVQDNC